MLGYATLGVADVSEGLVDTGWYEKVPRFPLEYTERYVVDGGDAELGPPVTELLVAGGINDEVEYEICKQMPRSP